MPFHALNPDIILHVVDKFLIELQAILDRKHVHLEVDTKARLWLAEHGYDSVMGARPMARLIAEELKKPLANELLFGQLAHGGEVRVTVTESGLGFNYHLADSGKQGSSKARGKHASEEN